MAALAGVATMLFAIGGVGSAFAGVPHINSTLEFVGDSNEGGGNFILIGKVHSPVHKCVVQREVKLFRVKADNTEVLQDIDWTSKRGFWAGEGHFPEEVAKMRMLRKSIRRNGHREVCKGDTLLQG